MNELPDAPLELGAPELAALGQRWTAAMQRGDFEAAWRETDRIELPRREAEKLGRFIRAPHHLVWNGTPFAGRDVLMRCEHGLGDSIQYLRYCALVREQARRVTVKVQPALLKVCAGMSGVDRLLDAWTTEPDPPHEVAIECMELAYAFRHTVHTLPSGVPYLPVERIAASSAFRLPGGGRRKVGLIWAASAWNPRRSIPLPELAPLAGVRGVEFCSLQQGPEQEQLGAAPFPITSLSERTSEVLDAAAAMLQLDGVITVDSMTAHLAGALGRRTWLLLTHDADWRWMRQGEESPWYPTMRLLRQPQPGAWGAVVQRLVSLLEGEE
jgi:hypothetical protein